MIINPVSAMMQKAKNNISFSGDLTPEMREIFSTPTISQSMKKDLWELSEVPDFTEAAETTSKKDLIEILTRIQKAPTNLLKMILSGGVHFGLIKEDKFKVYEMLPLENFAQNPIKKSLLDVIKKLPLKELELQIQDNYAVKKQYDGYHVCKEPTVKNSIISSAPLKEADEIYFENACYKVGQVSMPKDAIILIFDKHIEGKSLPIPHYSPTPKEIIGEPKQGMSPYLAGNKHKNDLKEFLKVPYFSNFIQDEDDDKLLFFANLDKVYDNILARMMAKDIVLHIHNPLTDEFDAVPIIDLERFVADEKYGINEKVHLLDLLSDKTISLGIFKLYMDFKSCFPQEDLEGLSIKSEGDKLECRFYTMSQNGYKKDFDQNQPFITQIKDYLDKVSQRRALIEFVHS